MRERRGKRRRPGWSGALGVLLLWAGAGAASASEPPACSDCHELDEAAFAESVHGALQCTDCHAGALELPHEAAAARADCATCHGDTVGRYAESIHGELRINGSARAPYCATCHGEIHGLRPVVDPGSPVHGLRLAETCGACHADPEMVSRFGTAAARPIQAYLKSVHARVIEAGVEGPDCSDCHDSHGIFPAADPRSTVFHQRVPETCGRCHGEIAEVYARSVHGTAAARGVRQAPVCTDCHGEHRILSPREPGSPVFATNVPKMTCGRCHGDLRLAEKFDMPADRVPAYADSYHGLASRSGRITVAHCGSCHGVHDTLPSSDPRSHTHKDNLAATCGQCHPGAGQRFAIGTVHITPQSGEHPVVRWARVIYVWLIWLTVGAMLLHNLLDLRRKALSPPAPVVAAPGTGPPRMGPGFRIAHGMLIVSFALLVYSGFALTYPETWWARPLLHWESGFGFRGWLHRAAAVLLLAALGFHAIHLALDRRARACIARMRPGLGDLHELRERVRWFLGRRVDPPRSPTVGYPEKAEYLALMWGLLVMAVTGFALWLDDLVLRWLPKWVTDLATTVHFYEAVLATLAILVWHFYFVIFDPVVYPMDRTWLTGRPPAGRVAERAEEEQDAAGHTAEATGRAADPAVRRRGAG